MTTTPPRNNAGRMIGGRYMLLSLIAKGGMGEVWKARDQLSGRLVAAKVLRPELSGEELPLSRLRLEAQNALLIEHPNIAAVLDSGEDDGRGWLVMELVDGRPLTDYLKGGQRLSAEYLIPVLIQIAMALSAAAAAGVVHRDIKPANVLVRPSGMVKITDFGISRTANQVDLTAAGMVMGTAQYLPPEQALGEVATSLGDLYALGVIAYEAVVGKRPFTGQSQVEIAFAHVNEAVPPLPADVPAPLGQVIMHLLEKEPSKRPPSGRALVRELVGAAQALGIPISPLPLPEPAGVAAGEPAAATPAPAAPAAPPAPSFAPAAPTSAPTPAVAPLEHASAQHLPEEKPLPTAHAATAEAAEPLAQAPSQQAPAHAATATASASSGMPPTFPPVASAQPSAPASSDSTAHAPAPAPVSAAAPVPASAPAPGPASVPPSFAPSGRRAPASSRTNAPQPDSSRAPQGQAASQGPSHDSSQGRSQEPAQRPPRSQPLQPTRGAEADAHRGGQHPPTFRPVRANSPQGAARVPRRSTRPTPTTQRRAPILWHSITSTSIEAAAQPVRRPMRTRYSRSITAPPVPLWRKLLRWSIAGIIFLALVTIALAVLFSKLGFASTLLGADFHPLQEVTTWSTPWPTT